MKASNDAAVLERNLAAFEAHGVILPEATADGPQVRLEAGPTDAVLSLGTADGRWVRLHSQRDPAAEADRQIAPGFAPNEPALIIVIGLGLGYVLDAIERQSSRTKVLALEPVPASLRHMLARRDWSGWLTGGRLRLLVGPDYSGASEAWRDFDADASMPPNIIHPVLAHRAGAGVLRAREVVERIAYGARSNLNARKQFAGRYLLNTLKNLPVIAREGNVDALVDAFKGVPAIVASAGPSLDRNIPWLRDFPDRAVLIAADTALRPLLGAGVAPPLVVSVDPSALNARHLTNLPDTTRTWLAAEGSMDPVVFEQFEGRTFIFNVSNHHPWPWLRELGLERGTLRAWGSVATSAFDLALKMGCDPIIFAGQDLAYTGGQPYCRGTTFEEDWATQVAGGNELPELWARRLAHSEAQIVDDISGRGVATMPQLVAFRDWFVEQTSILRRRTVINGTGGGILHGPGIRQADLGSVLASLPPLRELEARVRTSWGRMVNAPAGTNRTGPQLLEAFIRAGRGEQVARWASFASMTPGTLAPELDDVAAILSGGLAGAGRARRPTASVRVPPDNDPPRDAIGVYAPELARAYRAVLLDEPVPEWARAAADSIEPFDSPSFQKALDWLSPGCLLQVAERCESAAAFAHAVALFPRLVDKFKPDHPQPMRAVLISWMRCLFWQGDFEAAIRLADREALLPDPFPVMCLSTIYQFTGDHEQAVAKIEALVAAYPEMPDLRLNLAVRLAMNGNLQDAFELIDIDATKWPGRVLPHYTRGVCLRVHGDHEAAITTFSAIVDDWPYAAPELVVASVAAQQQAVTEQALRTIRESFRIPVVFVNVPVGQGGVVDEGLARLGAELAAAHHHVEVGRLGPNAVRLSTRATNAWKPGWQP